MITVNGTQVKPTIFPDKTSQVWKLPDAELEKFASSVTWEFEHEGEFMHLAQLVALLRSRSQKVELHLPYLPYARQDKEIANDRTFALQTFVRLLRNMGLSRVVLYDPHNAAPFEGFLTTKIVNFHDEAKAAFAEAGADVWCFPDAGAALRYAALGYGVSAEKVRDQLTGQITGIEVGDIGSNSRPMIVDDICDGGATFIGLAKLLRERGAREVFLFVSHGIFSRGLAPLFESGISRIFTPKGEQKL